MPPLISASPSLQEKLMLPLTRIPRTMARILPELLLPASYPFHHLTTTRFADMDRNHHINNVAISSAMEDGRFRFDVVAGVPKLASGARVVIVANYTDYVAEARYPAPLEVHVGIMDIGRTSWTLACLISQEGKPCAFSKAVNVATSDCGPVAMTSEMREAFEKLRVQHDTDSEPPRGVALRQC